MDYAKRYEELTRELEKASLPDRVYALLDFHLEWAAAVEKSEPEVALKQYLAAENHQSTIGSYATGSGEGLASMAALYEIMGKRARVLERLGRVKEALAVWEEIQADPNGQGDDTPAAAEIRRLKAGR